MLDSVTKSTFGFQANCTGGCCSAALFPNLPFSRTIFTDYIVFHEVNLIPDCQFYLPIRGDNRAQEVEQVIYYLEDW